MRKFIKMKKKRIPDWAACYDKLYHYPTSEYSIGKVKRNNEYTVGNPFRPMESVESASSKARKSIVSYQSVPSYGCESKTLVHLSYYVHKFSFIFIDEEFI